jgi:hypothetical protein
MEKLMSEIREYAKAVNRKPSYIIQKAGKCNGHVWGQWEQGASCTLKLAERIREWIAEHPPVKS